ncbi:DUF4393 domain-containing protein [Rhodobacteraceae bacterium B1Z28]|uniref:DUF4393 domain-containing protein n=1 Tax=Ruegeria haliotis TaxID=2747601 RepID=A0ABX2PMW2_9RHOB|nr:Abi-alpha family protein [Ruegeria haliotis]NVO55085.1 DUF4393 domain-containing protein [Ruegeria haliotis]
MTDSKNNNVINVNLPGDAIDKAAGQVISKLFGGATDGALDIAGNVFGGLIGDRIREWRTRNLIHTTARTAELLKEKGISLESAKALPMGDIYRIFEGASKEEEPSVQEMWAKLLASGCDPEVSELNRAVISVLEQISAVDAKVFQVIALYWKFDREYREKTKQGYPLIEEIDGSPEQQQELFQTRISALLDGLEGFSDYQVDFSTTNLSRLQCIAPSDAKRSGHIWGSSFERSNRGSFSDEPMTGVDPDKIADQFNQVSEHLNELFGLKDQPGVFFTNAFTGTPEANFQLTDFGTHFFETCVE